MILSGALKKLKDALARIQSRISGGPPHLRLGRLGEDLAANMLEAEGYTILERNIKVAGREVDIIAMEKEMLAFVEVKTRASSAFGGPLLAVDKKRIARLRQAAQFYAAQKGLRSVSIRFDVVTLDFTQSKHGKAELIRNAF